MRFSPGCECCDEAPTAECVIYDDGFTTDRSADYTKSGTWNVLTGSGRLETTSNTNAVFYRSLPSFTESFELTGRIEAASTGERFGLVFGATATNTFWRLQAEITSSTCLELKLIWRDSGTDNTACINQFPIKTDGTFPSVHTLVVCVEENPSPSGTFDVPEFPLITCKITLSSGEVHDFRCNTSALSSPELDFTGGIGYFFDRDAPFPITPSAEFGQLTLKQNYIIDAACPECFRCEQHSEDWSGLTGGGAADVGCAWELDGTFTAGDASSDGLSGGVSGGTAILLQEISDYDVTDGGYEFNLTPATWPKGTAITLYVDYESDADNHSVVFTRDPSDTGIDVEIFKGATSLTTFSVTWELGIILKVCFFGTAIIGSVDTTITDDTGKTAATTRAGNGSAKVGFAIDPGITVDAVQLTRCPNCSYDEDSFLNCGPCWPTTYQLPDFLLVEVYGIKDSPSTTCASATCDGYNQSYIVDYRFVSAAACIYRSAQFTDCAGTTTAYIESSIGGFSSRFDTTIPFSITGINQGIKSARRDFTDYTPCDAEFPRKEQTTHVYTGTDTYCDHSDARVYIGLVT